VIVIDALALTCFIMMEYGYEKIVDYIKDSISIDHVVKEVGNAI
jgi:hypothetical protein